MQNRKSLLIAVATYNEIDNLPCLVPRLREALPEAEILVVDDDSPDGTGRWCDEYRQQGNEAHFHVIHRRGERGLGSATLCALNWALQRSYPFVATLDADLSHDPATLREMFELISAPRNQRLGVVIGSRYVAGGQIEGWPWHRRVTSRLVNVFARTCLGLPTRDNTSAMRIYRSEALRRIDLNRIASSGYAYLEELLWRLRQARVSMEEVPIAFRDRSEGKSKAGLGEVVRSGSQLIRLAFNHLMQQTRT